MARPIKNNADYFSHDADMRNDGKVRALRRKYGMKGYAVWCFILESLTDADYFKIEITDITLEIMAGDYELPAEDLKEIINYLLKIQLLQRQDNFIFSKTHQDRFAGLVEYREKRRQSAVMKVQNPEMSNNDNVLKVQNTHSKGKERRVKERKVKESKEEILSNDNIKNESNDSKESENKINSSWSSFLDWLNKECPSVATMQQPLTITQYQTLLERYGKAELVQMLRTMENYKPLKQKNKSAYQTFLNWKKRDEDKNTRTINNHTKQCFNPDSTIGTNFRESDIEITDEDRNLLKNILATMPSIGR